jgi:hypothetical protein
MKLASQVKQNAAADRELHGALDYYKMSIIHLIACNHKLLSFY